MGAGEFLQSSGVFAFSSVTVGQHVSSMFLFLFFFPLSFSNNSRITPSVFRDERCEVFVLKSNMRERVRNRGVRQPGQEEEEEGRVRAADSSPLLSRYSRSSLCFLALVGPWPFLMEPFWGRRSCPRSCSVHGTPPCPSSLSRSESECMRAEEVGAVTGFRRAGRQRRRK